MNRHGANRHVANRHGAWQRLTAALVVFAALHGHGCQSIGLADDATEHRRTLALAGLTASGNTWLVGDEVQLRRHVSGLDALERRYRHAQQQATAMLVRNEQIRVKLIAAEAAQKAPGKSPPPASSSASGKPGDAKPGDLHSKLNDVTGVGEETPLQKAMIELVTARQSAMLASLSIDRLTSGLSNKYDALRDDRKATGALRELGEKHRLGPVRDYRRDAERARQIAAVAQKGLIPAFQECGRFRIGAIIAEEYPLTVSLAGDKELTAITDSAGRAIGVSAKSDSAKREFRRGDRTVQGAEIVIPSIRLGSVVLRNVPAVLLPPDAEDLGSQLSSEALRGHKVELIERQMALRLEPSGDAASR